MKRPSLANVRVLSDSQVTSSGGRPMSVACAPAPPPTGSSGISGYIIASLHTRNIEMSITSSPSIILHEKRAFARVTTRIKRRLAMI